MSSEEAKVSRMEVRMSYEAELRLTVASVGRYAGDMDSGLAKAASQFTGEAYRVLLSRVGPVSLSRVSAVIPSQNVRCPSCGIPQLAPGGKFADHKWLPPGAKRMVTCMPKKKKGPK